MAENCPREEEEEAMNEEKSDEELEENYSAISKIKNIW